VKLTKKEKEKLIGKKIIVDRILDKKNVLDWKNGNYAISEEFTALLRKIETVKLKKPIKAVIVGFTNLCEGKFSYDNDGMDFICTKRIPCIKIASGVIGKIQYAPISIIEKETTK